MRIRFLRLLPLTLAAVLLGPISAQELGPLPVLPEYIRYQQPGEAQERATVSRIERILAAEEDNLPIILAGPFLNQRLTLDALPGATSNSYIVPRVEGFLRGSGVVIKEQDSRKAFRDKLAAGHSTEVRRPTPAEFEYLWAIAPGDLQGPILVTTDGQHNVLWNFLADDVLIIEDVTAATSNIEETYQAFANLPQTALETERLPDFVSEILNNGHVPELLKEAPACNRPLIVFLTAEDAVESRVDAESLLAYVKGLKDVLARSLAVNQSRRMYLQFDLQPGEERILYVGAQPGLTTEAGETLLWQLRDVPSPVVRGPVRMFFVELPGEPKNRE